MSDRACALLRICNKISQIVTTDAYSTNNSNMQLWYINFNFDISSPVLIDISNECNLFSSAYTVDKTVLWIQ